MGYVAPALVDHWNVSKATLGPVFGAALVGVLVGSLMFSIVADTIGRRPVLIGATLFLSVVTLLTARASSVMELLVLRFIGGVAMGGILPNAVALAGEYSPRRVRIPVMMIVGCGFTVGAALGGLIASWVIPGFGWRAIFYLGARRRWASRR
jgi:MFS transporter, AAHS family, 4-hydroxybenzoate transporter